jgi:pimeloyl-ACP methyl ester carboxylesterase
MQIEVNGARLWFDVDGPSLVPDGATMRERPTVVLAHGGPGGYDHSYFKPHFERLTEVAQVVYLDLRDHGRSSRHRTPDWSFELAADDLRAFVDAVGIVRPVVLGHSMGGFIAMLYGIRHPGHAGGLILQGTFARFDLDRLAIGFRRVAGDEIAELARRDYSGDEISDSEWTRVYAAFGPRIPDADTLARRVRNPDVGRHGMDLMRRFDCVAELARIASPTLVSVGALDAVAPVEGSREIADALRPGIGRLDVIDGAGHFPWLDQPEAFWASIERFVLEVAG